MRLNAAQGYVLHESGCAPQPNRTVVIRGGQSLAIGTKCYTVNKPGMAIKRISDRLLSDHIPQLHRTVRARSDQGHTVRAKRHRANRADAGVDAVSDLPMGGDVPKSNNAKFGDANQFLTVWTERQGSSCDLSATGQSAGKGIPGLQSARDVPQPYRASI